MSFCPKLIQQKKQTGIGVFCHTQLLSVLQEALTFNHVAGFSGFTQTYTDGCLGSTLDRFLWLQLNTHTLVLVKDLSQIGEFFLG